MCPADREGPVPCTGEGRKRREEAFHARHLGPGQGMRLRWGKRKEADHLSDARGRKEGEGASAASSSTSRKGGIGALLSKGAEKKEGPTLLIEKSKGERRGEKKN